MSKPKTFRPWNPEQTLQLPPSPVEWLPEHHLVLFLLDLAGDLDLSAIYEVYEARDPRGVKAYEPRMMVVLLLYAYCVGIPSSRRIERACCPGCRCRGSSGGQRQERCRKRGCCAGPCPRGAAGGAPGPQCPGTGGAGPQAGDRQGPGCRPLNPGSGEQR
jgi:hypothetical protein